jgi:valyl-tRNA synthetase
MDSAYEAKKYEQEIYQRWEESGFFDADKLPDKIKEKFVVAIPPPNVTGSLHMGHALNNTIQDVLIRFYRMNGYRALWLPGTDHAGIATQFKVEQKLAKEGIKRFDLGREKFIAKVWEWKDQFEKTILGQLKTLGCSCDWSRKRFTMDEEYTKAVATAFKKYWDKGYIYRGKRVVNWCPRCQTSLSDLELEYREEKAKLYWIKYGPFVLATTRPETKLGDTAVAVNPKDKRYQKMVGQKYKIPGVLGEFEIVVVADPSVDMEFGSGAVKVTPAHDAADAEIALRHNLPSKQIINEYGRMMDNCGKYAGLKTSQAREAIVEDMQKMGLIDHIDENYIHNNAHCYRCGTIIEPIPSTQWFVKMEKLAPLASQPVKNEKIRIVPERYEKLYLGWLAKIRDWCISRQLWWGHQLPVWFCQKKMEEDNNFIVATEQPKKCPICGDCKMKQSEDVLDTWFSSALWPFAILGWPNETKDLKEYYPTSFLSTAQDILYLWVARMVFSSLEFTKKIPFDKVYIHPTVLALSGKRMSKSLGTGVDPLELVEKYGADAVRMGLMYQINREQQSFKFDERAILASRNFVNKLWNISRFAQIQNSNVKTQKYNSKLEIKPTTKADKWILSRLNTIIESTTEKIKTYQFGEATREIYDFVWHELADWYLEISKTQNSTAAILQNSLFIILKLLHPITPFVTEVIYQGMINQEPGIRKENLLMVESWPKADKKLINKKAEAEFEKIKNLIIEIRNWRKEKNIQPKEVVDYQLKKADKIIKENQTLIEQLAKVKLIQST